jgi:TRAP-type mannitol/chloroaromatic compound transport system permease small subunit
MHQISNSFSLQWINSLNDFLCKLVSWFTLFMVLLTFLIVVLRYGFNLGWIAMQESVMYLHGMVFLLGAAHTLRVNEHVRVDIFYSRLSPKKNAKVYIFWQPLFTYASKCFYLHCEFRLRYASLASPGSVSRSGRNTCGLFIKKLNFDIFVHHAATRNC